MIHYQDNAVTLHAGDCLDILRELPDNSVDAVVTDPPYGLGFMGKDWDAFGGRMMSEATRSTQLASDAGWTAKPYGASGKSAKPADGEMAAFQSWCQAWAAECLRVLKPGGHLLAFGGTRTWHRLAVAVEDAGFEMRDSIAWLYGSGFPKSLDVSKAIDKAAGAMREVVGQSATVTPRSGKSSSGFAPLRHIRWGDKHYAWEDAPAEAVAYFTAQGEARGQITAPATDDARRWQGWGTALKPAHEPVVIGRKPQVSGCVGGTIGSHLDRLEAEWRALVADPITPTGAAAGSFAVTDTWPSESAVITFWNTVRSWRECWADLCSAPSTSTTATTTRPTTDPTTLSSCLSQLTASNMLNPATSPPGLTPLASAVDHLFASAVCDWRATLALSAIEPATGSTPPSPPVEDGRASAFEPVVVARKPLAGTVAANVLDWGTGAMNIDGCRVDAKGETWAGNEANAHTDYSGEVFGKFGRQYAKPSNPAGRWPANVVLDEDAAAELDRQSGISKDGMAVRHRGVKGGEIGPPGGKAVGTPDLGYGGEGGASRFFKVVTPKATGVAPLHKRRQAGGTWTLACGEPFPYGQAWADEWVDVSCVGCLSARRYDPIDVPFRYVAKAPTRERPKGADGTAHPTVKPLALMRWLVRLVTPPGGVVLEPFAGSGTTVEACLLEGFRVIAIEREASYLPLIEQRIRRVVVAPPAAPAEATLFDLDFDDGDAA